MTVAQPAKKSRTGAAQMPAERATVYLGRLAKVGDRRLMFIVSALSSSVVASSRGHHGGPRSRCFAGRLSCSCPRNLGMIARNKAAENSVPGSWSSASPNGIWELMYLGHAGPSVTCGSRSICDPCRSTAVKSEADGLASSLHTRGKTYPDVVTDTYAVPPLSPRADR